VARSRLSPVQPRENDRYRAAPSVRRPQRCLDGRWRWPGSSSSTRTAAAPGCGNGSGNPRKDNPLVRTARVHQRSAGSTCTRRKKPKSVGRLMFCETKPIASHSPVRATADVEFTRRERDRVAGVQRFRPIYQGSAHLQPATRLPHPVSKPLRGHSETPKKLRSWADRCGTITGGNTGPRPHITAR
jgi:hypothetical protein